MGAAEVETFLSHLATARQVAAATQNQALAALLFLYREVLGVDLPWMAGVIRAKRPSRLPVVLTREEVAGVLDCLEGKYWLAAALMYGAGLRVVECLRLRVKDVEMPARRLTVRDGKGGRDRVSVLPDAVLPSLDSHLRSLAPPP